MTCELTKAVVLNYSGQNKETSKTVATRCKKLQQNEKKDKTMSVFLTLRLGIALPCATSMSLPQRTSISIAT